MGEDYVVQDLTPFDIACLLFQNEFWEERLKSIREDFGYEFEDDIVESNWAEGFWSEGFVLLWNEGYEHGIEG